MAKEERRVKSVNSFSKLGVLLGTEGPAPIADNTKKTTNRKKTTPVNGTNPAKAQTRSYTSPEYEHLLTKENVLVSVAKKSGFMELQAGFTNSSGDVIEPHWRNGKPIGKIFLNHHFYGITEKNFGKKIVGKVDVIKKTTSGPRKRDFIIINITNTPGKEPMYEMKLPKCTGKGIKVIGTNQEIEFRKR